MTDPYTPNTIPERERIWSFVIAGLLIAYGGYGVWANDLYIPGKSHTGIHLHDREAWLMYGAMICGSLSLLSVLADHFDRRNNEQHYRIFATVGRYLGVASLCLSLGLAVQKQSELLRVQGATR